MINLRKCSPGEQNKLDPAQCEPHPVIPRLQQHRSLLDRVLAVDIVLSTQRRVRILEKRRWE
jgi:hypothetical protein